VPKPPELRVIPAATNRSPNPPQLIDETKLSPTSASLLGAQVAKFEAFQTNVAQNPGAAFQLIPELISTLQTLQALSKGLSNMAIKPPVAGSNSPLPNSEAKLADIVSEPSSSTDSLVALVSGDNATQALPQEVQGQKGKSHPCGRCNRVFDRACDLK
jgi:hypothetical protein